jgi:hypothetical protein
VRLELPWHEIEPEKERFDFARYDGVVDGLRMCGLELEGVLGRGAPWAAAASGGDSRYPPDDPADFAAYVAATVLHFRGRVRDWEIWSEPNDGHDSWRPREDARAYGALLKAAAETIREIDPTARIVLGGLRFHAQFMPGAVEFLQELYVAHPDLGGSYDLLGLHAFPLYPPVAEPEDEGPPELPLTSMLERVRALLAAVGDSKPIAVTAFGWPVYGPVDAQRQASFLVRAHVLLAAAGVEQAVWWTWRDGPTAAAFPPDDAFGLISYDPDPTDAVAPAPKNAYDAYVTLLELAGDATISSDLRVDLGLDHWTYAYRLRATRRSITVIWRALAGDSKGVSVWVPPQANATSGRLVDMYGHPRELFRDPRGYEISAVKSEPLYLIEE